MKTRRHFSCLDSGLTHYSFRDRHYLSVPPSQTQLLADAISRSSVLAADRGAVDDAMADITNTAGGSGGGEFGELGVDPNLDPELAMVCNLISVLHST